MPFALKISDSPKFSGNLALKLPIEIPESGDNPALEWALGYGDAGMPVFPLTAGTKVPLKGSKGLEEATTDEAQIRTWFETNPDYGIAIRCGEFFVLDVDAKSGGPESLKVLTALMGPLPETLTQSTAWHPGKHIFLRAPIGRIVKSGVNVLKNGPLRLSGLDVRSAGSYVCAEPTVLTPSDSHPGGSYSWLNFGAAIAVAPAWLLDLMDQSNSGAPDGDDNKPALILAAEIHEGEGRNNAMYRLACSLMRTLNRDMEAVERVVIEQNKKVCNPSLPDSELKKTLNSAFKFFKDGKADIEKQYKRSMVEHDKAVRTYEKKQLIEARVAVSLTAKMMPDWMGYASKKKNGVDIEPSLGTAILMLESSPDFHASLAFNEFTSEVIWVRDIELHGGVTIKAGSKLKDEHALYVINHAEMLMGIVFQHHIVDQAIIAVAKKQSSHPVRNYLAGLPKPEHGEPSILDTWLVKYLNCPDTPYVRAVGRKFAVSAVARVMNPGCQVDHMLVLEGGEQGEGKTSAIGRLFSDEWVGGGLKKLTDRDELMKLRGKWCFEMGEMSHLAHNRVEEIKNFVTQKTDRMRVPYGRSVEDFQRQCVFIGTTNESEYLNDDMNRRYWPVRVTKKMSDADKASLEHDRDLIWAEAYERYLAGEAWWFTDADSELETQAREEQAARRIEDPWQEIIDRHLSQCDGETTMGAIFAALNIPVANMRGIESKRIVQCLTRAKWVRDRKTGGTRAWFYRPKDKLVQEALDIAS